MANVGDGCGQLILYDALCNVGHRVVLSYLVMCYGDRVTGHSGGVCVCVCGHSQVLVLMVTQVETRSTFDIK